MSDKASEINDELPPELELALISLAKANQDLIVVIKLLPDAEVADEIIGFHLQQAIEKSLKAVLMRYKIDYPHTHNLRYLIDLCRQANIETPVQFQELDVFNRYAVQLRYDLLPTPSPSPLDRESALDAARQVWNWATSLVQNSSQGHPDAE